MTRRSVDLATELGESFYLPPCGLSLDILGTLKNSAGLQLHPRHTTPRQDGALLNIVSTGYVACGGHSGDAVVMAQTIHELVAMGKAIGAHPSYPDIFGFGQVTPSNLDNDQLFSVLVSQLGSVCALAKAAGTQIQAVKCHGALAFDVAYKPEVTITMARAMLQVDSSMALVIFAGSKGIEAACGCGIRVIREAYVDRRYDINGRILNRKLPGALIVDAKEAVEQAISIILRGRVLAEDGEWIDLAADSLCLHADTPGSRTIAEKLQVALSEACIVVKAA
ncbi:hypothetical protein PFICI_02164 [Pestalotiopsis fici W106-1]|uniref:Lactam utilization protein lamB n=1 Tax=Pestalotiopsis fici (strain W106-1 / CGMCC3.15140) TaxID=1229662 RepID=W3XDP2_PESFW|nr:uncharacterized protein PFICI_02164 [Pestalotiopsis fici W106-1]ETS84139.1 hypothetical protein PFICI_02164 [Pestalotiopsis fici W106-1]